MVLASAEKIGTASPYRVIPLKDLTGIITEHGVPDEPLDPYRQLGIGVVKAGPAGSSD
jgi:DeoR/GlpR family transcriptional regulator of sugar metabolism